MKKLLGLFITIALLLSVSIPAFAATNNTNSEQDITLGNNAYEAVIKKLNAEYGLNMRFATDTELEKFNIVVEKDINKVSLHDFEKQLRAQIEANKLANEQAKQKIAENQANLNDSIITGSGVVSNSKTDTQLSATTDVQLLATTSTVTRSKPVDGATVYLTATVTDASGYWTYYSINDVRVTYTAGVNTEPAFYAETYNYSLIDSRRTCALSLYGYTIGDWGVIIDDNAYRYVEFWAGSGM